MCFFRSAVTRLALVALVVAAGAAGGLVASVGTSPAAAAKPLTCPDGSTGVTDGPWSVTCSGNTAAGLTVSVVVSSTGSLKVTATAPNAGLTISYVTVSFLATGGEASLVVSQNGLVTITVAKTGGGVTTTGASESPPPNVVKMTWH